MNGVPVYIVAFARSTHSINEKKNLISFYVKLKRAKSTFDRHATLIIPDKF